MEKRILSDGTKDHVAKYYNFMIKNNLLDNHTLEESVGLAVRHLSIGGNDNRFIEEFIKRIDEVKEIYENQPTYKLMIAHDVPFPNEDEIGIRMTHEEIIRTYDIKVAEDRKSMLDNRYKTLNPDITINKL